MPGPKIVIIGLDGADWTLLDPLFADGVMPNLKAFVERGARARLQSVLPTNSMSAWTSFMTGVNPGKHGVYEFVRNTRTPFRTRITNSSVIRFPTMFDVIGSVGMRSCVLDMPPLYPPRPIEGVMIGGMGAFADPTRPYGWPPEAVNDVGARVGAFVPDVTWVGKAGREAELVDDLCANVAHRLQLSKTLLQDGSFDLFCTVFVAPDRAQHVFWQDLVDRGSKFGLARRFYVTLDEALGSLLDSIDLASTDVMIVSDHGFRATAKTFDVNEFLFQAGLARWTRREWPVAAPVRALARRVPLPPRVARAMFRAHVSRPRALAERSVAYSDQADCVNINLRGRETTGSVDEASFGQTCELVASKLLEYRDPENARQVVDALIRGDRYFSGGFAGEAPDLVLQFAEGYAYGSNLTVVLLPWPYCQGVHSMNGIIAGAGPSFRVGTSIESVSIMDVAPTVLALMGAPAPAALDGKVARELLSVDVEAVTGAPVAAAAPAEPGAYSDDEEALVKERLQGLGYID